jgi:uncharacterized protein YfiM (DUF2279 family)
VRRAVGALLAATLSLAGTRDAHASAASPGAPGVSPELVAGSGFADSFAAVVRPEAVVLEALPGAIFDTPLLETSTAPPKPKWFWVGVGAALVIGGSAASAYTESPRYPWHFENEGWFGQNTYVGGADKASHFVSFYAVSRMVNEYNLAFHVPKYQAALLASVESFLGGLTTEIGDGTNKFGFSWEDLTMDALGAATGLAIMRYNLDDTFGFRAGWVPGAPDAERGGLGRDYSSEIYTADFKFKGIARRAHFNPGPAQFFLFSITYGTKGYPYDLPEVRERQLGFEIGINFGAIFEALKVPRNKWWGVCLYTLFDIIRFPYTAIGWRYDLNSGTWVGPDTGNTYPTGGLKPAAGVSVRLAR